MRTFLLVLLLFSMPLAGASDPDGKPMPAIGTVQVLFTPGQNATGTLVEAIRQARQAILVQSYSFTSNEIAFALIEAKRRGVDVQVVSDAEQARKHEYNRVPLLAQAGVKVWLDEQHQSAHNKVMVIDGGSTNPVVVTGSMNFTYAGQFKNAENMLILRGNKPLAEAYIANWQHHKQHALPFR